MEWHTTNHYCISIQLFRDMPEEDIFTAMIKEELNQFNHYLFKKQKQWLKKGEYKKIAEYSLKQIRVLGVFVILSIIIFSLISVYHFIGFGNSGETSHLTFGLILWAFVIFSTIYYTRDISIKKRSMMRILKLLSARSEYIENNKT